MTLSEVLSERNALSAAGGSFFVFCGEGLFDFDRVDFPDWAFQANVKWLVEADDPIVAENGFRKKSSPST